MDSIDTICLFFHCEHFVKLPGVDSGLDCANPLEVCRDSYTSLEHCFPPNKEFALNKDLLYQTLAGGEKKCNLGMWLQPINPDSYKLFKKLFSINKNKEYREDLVQKSLKEVLHYFPNDLENLLRLGNTESDQDIRIKNLVLKTIDSNSTYQLSEKSIKYLEDEIFKIGSADKYEIELAEPAARVLTNYVTHHDENHGHIDFLVDLVKRANIDDSIREAIFKKFGDDISEIKNWKDDQFDSFVSLLDYDGKSHSLAKGILSAQKHYDYTCKIDKIPLFEKLLNIETIREDAANFISKSLEKILLNEVSVNSLSEIGKIEEHAVNLFNKTGKLKSGLVNAIFEAYNKLELYKKNQSHFNGLIVDLVASDKLLPITLLKKLAEPLLQR